VIKMLAHPNTGKKTCLQKKASTYPEI